MKIEKPNCPGILEAEVVDCVEREGARPVPAVSLIVGTTDTKMVITEIVITAKELRRMLKQCDPR